MGPQTLCPDVFAYRPYTGDKSNAAHKDRQLVDLCR